jgi:hypothetical protein
MRVLFILALFSAVVLRAELALPPPEVEHGCLKLGFDRLDSFKFIAPEYDPAVDAKGKAPSGDDQIPAGVKAWNGKDAVITGFMLPTKLENGKATEFLIMANQMACCFGTVPNMNDWVIVRMPQGTEVVQDVPLSFYGRLTVGAIFENGYMTGIYQLDAEGMEKTSG